MATAQSLRDLTPYFLFLLLTATLGPLLFGYHLAELNAPQEVITCVKKSITSSPAEAAERSSLPQCIPMNPTQFGLVTSIFTLGGLLGALGSGPLTSSYGRLRPMIGSSVFAALGPVFEALAPNVGVFAVGRFVSGIGAGAATVIVPIFIAEISPPGQKGFFGTLTQVMINVGILTTQVLGLFLSKGQFWRIILAVGGAIAIGQTISLVIAGSESPKWLVEQRQATQAKRVLRRIRGQDTDIEQEFGSWGHEDIERSNEHDNEESTLLNNGEQFDGATGAEPNSNTSNRRNNALGFVGVIKHQHYRPAVFAVVMIMVAQQLCGINSIVMYGVGLLSDLLAANSALLNVGVAVLNIIVTISAAPLIERIGRKTCILFSITGMGINSVLLGIGIMKHIPALSAIAVVLFVASFGFGLGPVPFILSSELVGPEAVGAVQSWALGANWIATFVVAQFFPVLNERMGKGQVYFIFAALALVFGVFTAWYVPETKGKADADEVWGRRKRPDSTRQD